MESYADIFTLFLRDRICRSILLIESLAKLQEHKLDDIESYLHDLLPHDVNFILQMPILTDSIVEAHLLIDQDMKNMPLIDFLLVAFLFTRYHLKDLVLHLIVLSLTLLVLILQNQVTSTRNKNIKISSYQIQYWPCSLDDNLWYILE